MKKDQAVGFSSPGWFQPPVEKIIAYERTRLVVWAADAMFAMEQLTKDRAFEQRVNWKRIGAFGHSAGARVAAYLCQSESRIAACLNLDGFAGFQPFFAEEGSVFQKSFAMIHMELPDPNAEQLVQMRMTREDMLREKNKQRNAGIRLFESVHSGSVEVTLSTAGIQHGSFTDLPILSSAAGAPQRAMAHLRAYSLAFFERALKGNKRTLLDETSAPSDVTLDRYSFKGPVARK